MNRKPPSQPPLVSAKDIRDYVKPHDRDKHLSVCEKDEIMEALISTTKLTLEQRRNAVSILFGKTPEEMKEKSDVSIKLEEYPPRKQREIQVYIKKTIDKNIAAQKAAA